MAAPGLLPVCLLVVALATAGCGGKPGGPSSSPGASGLAHGYTRDGPHIRFKGKRIDKDGAGDIVEFSVILQRKVNITF